MENRLKTGLRCAAVAGLIGLMAGIASLLGEKEIFFPEILALAVGSWALPKQPWHASKLQIWLFVSAAAVFGVLVVRFVPFPVWAQVAVAFAFAAVVIGVSNDTVMPMLSACMLPVLLQTDSWTYPLSASAFTGAIVLVRWGMEKAGWAHKRVRTGLRPPAGPVALRWLECGAVVVLLALCGTLLGVPYILAPPLVVVYTTMAHTRAFIRTRPVRLVCLLAGCALLGAAIQLGLAETLGVPLWLCAMLAAALALLLFTLFEMVSPPAGALALLPVLLPARSLWWYPLEVLVGAAILVALAHLRFRQPIANRPAAD